MHMIGKSPVHGRTRISLGLNLDRLEFLFDGTGATGVLSSWPFGCASDVVETRNERGTEIGISESVHLRPRKFLMDRLGTT